MKNKPYERALALMSRGAAEKQAYPLLVQAMNEGDYRAHYALGTWYLHGTYLDVNKIKAVRLLRDAAENGVANAAFDLAVCYEKGIGVRKNLKKAAAMYFRAWRCGDEAAIEELRRIFYWGIGVERNRDIAEEFARFSTTAEYSD